MYVCVLLFLCLLCDIPSVNGEVTTPVKDIESSVTDTTPVSNLDYTTVDNATPSCESAPPDVIKTNQELANLKNQLDKLFEQIMRTCRFFVAKENHNMSAFVMNLSKNYVEISKQFLQGIQFQIWCQNHTIYGRRAFDDISEYQEKLEIIEILSNELGKVVGKDTEDANFQKNKTDHQNVRGEIMSLFGELHRIVMLNKRLRELRILEEEQYYLYMQRQKIAYLDDEIRTLTEMIGIQNEIMRIVKSSESMKYLFDEEYDSKPNLRYLTDVSNLEYNLNMSANALMVQYEERKIEEALLHLNQVIRPIVLGLIFVVGIIGNGVMLHIFINHLDMRTPQNVIIINLNVSDILGLIFNILLYIVETLMTDWTLGVAFCKIYRYCRFLTIGLSIYSLVVISLQRFLTITNCSWLSGFRSQFLRRYQPFINVVLVWVLASAFASPRAVKANVRNLVCWSGTSDDKEFFDVMMYVDFVLYFVLPFIIIAVTSGITSWRLKHSFRDLAGEAMDLEKAMKARALSSKIFVALIIVFAICYMPYFLFMVCDKNINLDAPFMTKKYISFALYCLIHSNATFNPIALYLANAKLREYMTIYLSCRRRRRKLSREASRRSNPTIETRM